MRIPKRVLLRLLPLVAMFAAAEAAETAGDPPARPDIIYIIVDDMGFSDIGCYGGEIDTPTLDRLAAEGIRFSQFYNASKCEPSRASIMTGYYWPVTGLGGQRGATLGEVMRQAGYATFALGKWHLAGHPEDRGFDRFFGHLGGASSYFPPLSKTFRDGREHFQPSDPAYYVTDGLTDRAIDFITELKAREATKPYFMYLAYNAPHNPLQAPAEDIEKYRGQYMAGWEHFRRQRFERMKQLGIIGPETKLSPKPTNIPDWESLTPAQKELEDLRMATYAAMIDRLDQNLARLFHTLSEEGLDKNLLVMFMSDNGASPFARTDERMLEKGTLPGDPRSNWEIGTAWANVSNTPLRLYKRNQHEGGISTPFIAWWPGRITEPGSITSQPAHIIDLMPTLLELAGGTYAAGKGKQLPPLPGKSLLPVFEGKQRLPHDQLYFQLFDHRAIRSDNWKLTAVDGKAWELYDLSTDRSETNDLSESEPALVEELSKEWEKWWETAYGRPYSEFSNPTPPEFQRDDREGGAPYVPTAIPSTQEEHSQRR